MRRITSTLLLVALGLGAGACANGGDRTANRVATRSIPTAADAVVIRVDTRGGYTSAEYQLGIVPELSVFGDGRVVVSGPVTEQYPPHALPNLLTGTLPSDEVAHLVRAASDAGLLGRPLDFGQPGVTDMPTTTVTIATLPPCPPDRKCGEAHHVQDAYALGYQRVDGDSGLTAAQRDARKRLGGFVQDATAAATKVATQPYRASEVAVYIQAASTATIDDITVGEGHAVWPLGDLATVGTEHAAFPGFHCVALRGTEASTALAAAAQASSTTRWRSGGAEYTIVFRPLLPDEHACP